MSSLVDGLPLMPNPAAELQRCRMRPKPVALVLIALGVVFLLSNLGMLPRLGPLFSQWWPAILIVVGVAMLFRR
jgi:hypothetical protein